MMTRFYRVWNLLTPERKRQVPLVLLVMVIAAGFQAVGIGSIHPFLEVVSQPQAALDLPLIPLIAETFGWTSNQELVILVGVVVFLLIIFGNALLTLSEWVQLRFRWGVTHSLAARLLHSYASQDYDFYLTHNTSKLTKNIVDETNRINIHIINPILRVVSQSVLALSIGAVLLWADPMVTVFVVGFVGGAYGLAYLLIRKRVRAYGASYMEANEARFHILQQVFGGIKTLKLFGREGSLVDEFEDASARYARNLAAKGVVNAVPKYIIEGLAFGSIMLVLLGFVVTGSSVESVVPLVGLFAFAGYRMMPAFREIYAASSSFQFLEELLESIESDLAGIDDRAFEHTEVDPLPIRRTVELRDVTFTYPGADNPALQDISITVNHGSMTAIVGPTGAGKSTLADLLLGLLVPTEGTLYVDGCVIEEDQRPRLQRQVGYVPQSIFLSDDTVRKNIAFGVPADEIDDEAVVRAAKTAQIHCFIEDQLDAGYETFVGEDGVRLSGGQRQRIGIARALYTDPEWLVLDEATSDVDGVTQARITTAINGLRGTKTLVVIAHRLSTLQNADCIYLIHQGVLVDSGTYEDLYERSEKFRAMAEGTLSKPSQT